MLELLQVVVAVLGVAAMGLAVHYGWFFFHTQKRIGRSMVWMLLEQVVSAGGTLLFSLNSLYETVTGSEMEAWNAMDARIAIAIRCVMFAAMIHSTVHLSRTVQQVLDK